MESRASEPSGWLNAFSWTVQPRRISNEPQADLALASKLGWLAVTVKPVARVALSAGSAASQPPPPAAAVRRRGRGVSGGEGIGGIIGRANGAWAGEKEET